MNLNNQASFTMQILPGNTFFFFSKSAMPYPFCSRFIVTSVLRTMAVVIVEEGWWSGIAYINRYFTLYTKP